MPTTEKCDRCHGERHLDVLVSMHDDKKERVDCDKCHGKGEVRSPMTEDEEREYWNNYW